MSDACVGSEEKRLDDTLSVLLIFSAGAQTRRKILICLKQHPRNCQQISKELKLNWWTVQKHLNRLKEYHLIDNIRLGRMQFYKITSKGEEVVESIGNG